MNDRELLELAARAAGYDVMRTVSGHMVLEFKKWNPLEDDGDAFRLMIACKINIEFWAHHDSVGCSLPGAQGATTVAAIGNIELRRAIVRAAAEIGKSMEGK